MRINWNRLRLATLGLALLAATGCGGVGGSYSVSPASFFLPGLVKNDSAQTLTETESAEQGPAPLLASTK